MMANTAQMEKSLSPGISGSQLKERGSGLENEETKRSRDSSDLTINDYLPPEVLIKIFHYLDFYDIQVARLCCKQWFYISNYPEFASERILKITEGVLNSEHPAANVISASKIENLYLEDIRVGDVDELFKQIGPSLKTLTLESHYLEDHLLTFTLFTNLRSLTVCGFGDGMIPEEAETLPSGDLSRLKELELTENDPYVNKYLLRCSLCSDFLEKLTLEVSDELEVEVLKILDKQAETLKILDLHFDKTSGPDADVSQWTRIASKLSLKKLSLRYSFSYYIVAEMVKNQKSLRSLNLERFDIDDEQLTLIVQELPQLERIFLIHCYKVTDIGVRQLAKLSKLTVLGFDYCKKITSVGIRNIIGQGASTRLQELYMRFLHNVDMDAVCYCAQNLQHLIVFDLFGSYKAVTDKSVKDIFEYQRNLEDLCLNGCEQLTDFGMLGLSSTGKLVKLEWLYLRDCRKLSDETLCGISAPHLAYLDIRGCSKMTSRGIPTLVKNCPAIEEIAFTYSAEMNEEVIAVLTKGLSGLRTLTIDNCSEELKQGTKHWKRIHFFDVCRETIILKRRTSI